MTPPAKDRRRGRAKKIRSDTMERLIINKNADRVEAVYFDAHTVAQAEKARKRRSAEKKREVRKRTSMMRAVHAACVGGAVSAVWSAGWIVPWLGFLILSVCISVASYQIGAWRWMQ